MTGDFLRAGFVESESTEGMRRALYLRRWRQTRFGDAKESVESPGAIRDGDIQEERDGGRGQDDGSS